MSIRPDVSATPQIDPEQTPGCTITPEDGRARGMFGGLTLSSCFQPIFSLAHQRIVGFEALVRAHDADGLARPPLEVFADAARREESTTLDRLCRLIHLNNFAATADGKGSWLFLNINSRAIVDREYRDDFFRQSLARHDIPPHRIVIEILETALADDSALADAVRYYRDLGCLIAIDDFGAGHSNFDRIGHLRPDIVKIDRSIIAQAARDSAIRAIVPGMVSLLHEAGSLVVMEGIESEQEAMIAMNADADFVQGHYFAHPAPDAGCGSLPPFGRLFERFRQGTTQNLSGYRNEIAPYINGIGYTSVLLQTGHPFGVACQAFLDLPRAERCFLLDAGGLQIGDNQHAPDACVDANPRYEPLRDARGANWSRRHYFRRAITRPDRVQITRPYLSAASATPCVTVSIAFRVDGSLRVLCGDLRWDDYHATIDYLLDP